MLDRRAVLGVSAGLAVPVAARSQGLVPVRIGYVPVIGASALFVSAGTGAARAAGLACTLVRFDSGPGAVDALASGTLDALAIGVAPVAVARARGLPVSVVSAAAIGGSGFAAGPALSEAFQHARGDPRRAFAVFRQRTGRPARLATLPVGAVPRVALLHWLWRLSEVDRADVEISALGIPALQQAMLAGAVDGGTLLEPSLSIVIAREPRIRLVATAGQMFPNIPGVVLSVTEAFTTAQPGAAEALVRSFSRATDLLSREPANAAPHVRDALGTGFADLPTITRALSSPALTFTTDLDRIRPATDRMLAFQIELGDFTSAPTTDSLFDRRILARIAATR
jgi:NitT/TauT family transport system substrate-binding protein